MKIACKMFRLSPYVTANPAMPIENNNLYSISWFFAERDKKIRNALNDNYVPGSMTPSGIEIKNTKQKANVMEDNMSKRKQSHSIAPAM